MIVVADKNSSLPCAVGSLAGAISGALIGLATESGFLRGAGVGAISGAIFSIEVVESSLELWNSRESGIWSFLYVVIICRYLIASVLSEMLKNLFHRFHITN